MTAPQRCVVLTREFTFHDEADAERTLRPGAHVVTEAFEAAARAAGAIDEAATAAANPVRRAAAPKRARAKKAPAKKPAARKAPAKAKK
jgi:hypothetical protein